MTGQTHAPLTVVPSPDSADARRISALATVGDRTVRLATTANVPLALDSTAWLAPATLAGMRLARDVVVYGSVDSEALAAAAQARSVLHEWFPDQLREVAVDAPMSTTSSDVAPRGVGAFFSGGVDSYYTALKHLDEITHLIFIHGFDIDLTNEDLAEQTRAALRKSAADLGKTLIEVRTDLRGWLDSHGLQWGYQSHGALLAHVGHALSTVVGKIYVPSSFTVDDLHPWGTHPDLDQHWSGSDVRFVHDGVEASRPVKIRLFVDNDAAMRNLRVCWWNGSNEYNCGECEKCVRTMLNLYLAGGLERCATLPHVVSPKSIERLHFPPSARPFLVENLEDLRASDVDNPELEASLQRVLDRPALENNLKLSRNLVVGVRNMFTAQFVRYVVSKYRPTANTQYLDA